MNKNLIRNIGFPVLASCLCLNFLLKTYARDTAGPASVPEFTGSISVTMRSAEDDEPIPGGSLTLYRIGGYVWINTRYLIQLEDEFIEDNNSIHLDIEHLDDIKAQELADLADKNDIAALTVQIGEDGKAGFDALDDGLYLIAQREAPQGYLPVNPFFVTIPLFDHALGYYIYDVDATPKTRKYEPLIPLTPLEPAMMKPAELIPAMMKPAELTPAMIKPAELTPAMVAPAELTPAMMKPAELTPAMMPPAELTPAMMEPAELIPASPSQASPSDTSPTEPPASESASDESSLTHPSNTASHRGNGSGGSSVVSTLPPQDSMDIDGDIWELRPLAPTGEGRKILAGAALCFSSGLALAVMAIKRIRKGGS